MTPDQTVFLVDDEADLRKALTRLLKAEGHHVVAFGSAEEFIRAQPPTGGSCLVLDFITGHGDIPMSVRAIKAGATDFLTKPVNDDDLLRAVGTALQLSAETAALRERLALLTPREREVLTHVITGKLNKQIADDLGTGEHTIKVHRGRVMEKLGVQSVADLVRLAEKLGIEPAG
jgi:FixJ family two-component response regulator